MTIHDKINRILQAGISSAKTREGRGNIDSITVYAGYAEAGCNDHGLPVVAGNWNKVTKYIQNQFVQVRFPRSKKKRIRRKWSKRQENFRPVRPYFKTIDDTPCRVGILLEKLGVGLEWCDEWVGCDECSKCFRTSPDSYSWQMSGIYLEGSWLCHDCLMKDPSDYLESLEGNGNKAISTQINLEEHGYVKLASEFEHGFHPGQNADPNVIAKLLREAGASRFIFVIDSCGQFDLDFSVWLHKDDEALEAARIAIEEGNTDGPDIAEGMRKALQDAAQKIAELPQGEGVRCAQCNVTTGTATARLVPPEEFSKGIRK